jgi:SAM-dependent methyltransferase
MFGRDAWMTVAASADDEIRERILTGYKDGKPFTPYIPTLALPSNLDSVLDFGCGLGRNFPFLTAAARSVTGFDLPPMIERCRGSAADRVDLLSADWDRLKGASFDLIFASLVLQHIEPAPVRLFLRDFSRMTPCVYLLTRNTTDFGENLLGIIAETGLFVPGEWVEVEHDPATHQLKVMGRSSFDEARRRDGDRHFEVLLRTRTGGGSAQWEDGRRLRSQG